MNISTVNQHSNQRTNSNNTKLSKYNQKLNTVFLNTTSKLKQKGNKKENKALDSLLFRRIESSKFLDL